MTREEYNKITQKILDACISVHKEMGPGLLESVYESCLLKEFELIKVNAKNQIPIPLQYKGQKLNQNFIIDILIENEIVLELKSVESLSPVHNAQIISYLKLANKRLGFQINFDTPLLKNGFKRFVNNF